MAAENKGGSDLDVFEGLAKKGAGRSAGATPPPAPPLMGSPAPHAQNDVGKRTLIGVSVPTVPSSNGNGPPPPAAPQHTAPSAPTGSQPGGAPAAMRSAPPPPPGRANLPSIAPPPPKFPSSPPPRPSSQAPAPGLHAPPMASAAPGARPVEMDWDDDDEATQVFDKSPLEESRAPRPAAGMAAPSTPFGGVPKSTLLGMSAPHPTGSAVPSYKASAPPPPPTPPSPATRALNQAMATPGPTGFAPHGHHSSAPPGMPPQINTAPLPMPPVRSSFPPAGAVGAPTLIDRSNGMPVRLDQTSHMTRSPLAARPLSFWLATVGAVALLFIVVFMLWPRSGRLLVNVGDAKGGSVSRVEIFVDGKKQCDTAPCVVGDVTSGPHAIKVIATGYDVSEDRIISVDPGKDTSVDFAISSGGGGGGGGGNVASGRSNGTGIKVNGTQPGVKLFVDGKEIGPLPQDLRDLSPGDHRIRLAGTDRYAPIEKNVIVARGEMEDLGTQTLRVVKGKATITLGTNGAKVYLVSGADRRDLPSFPISVDIDTSKQWTLEATKTGFADYRQPISFEDGQAENSFSVTLEPRTSSASAYSAPAAPRAARSAPREPAEGKESSKEKEPALAAASEQASAGGDEGLLNINSIPPSLVQLDGRNIGNTPKLRISVAPGSHTITFTNTDLDLKKQITVNVGAGETKPAFAKLRD